MKQFTGAITALVTPFQENGKVDIKSLKNLVRFQLENDIDGIVPCGSTGEAATLTADEYELVVRTVVQEVNGNVPVIAGAGSNDTQKAIYFSRIAKKAGADALLHVTPYYNKPTSDGLVAHFSAISTAVKMPIILYNVPGRTGVNLTATTTLRIALEVPHIVGIKEASGKIEQMMDILQDAPSGFSVLSGDDAFTFPLMALGGDGCISVVANEVPKEFSVLVHAALDGNWERARQLHYELLPLMTINFIETNPLPVKTALAAMGKIKEVFRLPLVPMQEHNKNLLLKVMKSNKWL